MELKKGETIMTDASLHLPAACLHEAFSNRSGVPPGHFELYYLGKRLESEVALASWGVGKNATIEVKMRGRGGGCVRSKEASAAADRSAEQHPAGELDRFTADKAAAEEMVAEETVAERAIEEETVVEQAAVKTSAEKPLSEKATVETAAVEKAAAEATLFVATAGVESETALSSGGIEKDDKKGEQPKVEERVPPSSSKAHNDKKLQDAQDAEVEEIKAMNFEEPGGDGVGVGGVEGGGVKIKLRGRGGADASGALEPAVEQAAVKIQALMRGNLARDKYKDIRDEEARRQWLKYYVLTGNYAEAHELGWDDGNTGEPGVIELDGGFALEPAQATLRAPPYTHRKLAIPPRQLSPFATEFSCSRAAGEATRARLRELLSRRRDQAARRLLRLARSQDRLLRPRWQPRRADRDQARRRGVHARRGQQDSRVYEARRCERCEGSAGPVSGGRVLRANRKRCKLR